MDGNETIDILTLEEAADFLGLSKRTVVNMARDKQFPVFRIGGAWRFRKTHLVKWMAEHPISGSIVSLIACIINAGLSEFLSDCAQLLA